MPDSATIEAYQTQELDDDSLLKDILDVKVFGDEKLLDAEYMAVKSYEGNDQAFDMYRIVTDTTPDKTMSFAGMSLAPYELTGTIIQDMRPVNHSLEFTLTRLLADTDWRLGHIDSDLNNVTTTFYYVSVKEALKELQSLVGCEFVFKVEISEQKITDKWVEVYREMGNRTKKRFNYGTNALTVVRETNKADIYTALIGRGKGEETSSADENESGQAGYGRKITFDEVEWSTTKGDPLNKPKGQYYLEMPQATLEYGMRNVDGTLSPRVGIVEFDDEEDPINLLKLTYEQLKVSARPKVLFKSTVANIGTTGIGDTVTIHRHDLNLHYETRVRKVVRNKLNDNKTQVELGDVVVTPSTKRAKQNNATIKNLKQELEKAQQEITETRLSADGKTNNHYGATELERKRTGDTWYRPHPSITGEYQVLTWDGNAWELILDTSDTKKVERELEEVIKPQIEQMTASIAEADKKGQQVLEKVGLNTNLIGEHKKTLDDITTIALPDINKSVSDTLKKANDAMTEAQKADGKIADLVSRNGLVSDTTVDTKINDATGEINKKITTVESKIPTEIGGRNYIQGSDTRNHFDYMGVYTGATVTRTYGQAVSEWGATNATRFKTVKGSGTLQLTNGVQGTLQHEGKVATYSIYVKNVGSDRIWISNQFTDNNTVVYVEAGETTRVKITGTVRPTHDFTQFNFNSSSDIDMYIWHDKLELGSVMTDWTPAPEDNYTQEEFSIFESTYKEDVKGINSTLTELSNSKLDGKTYTNFYENDYKKTAQSATDAYTAVNKIVDANGNAKDTFAKAVYERNATRQTAYFQNVTKDLVTNATYTAGIDGVKESMTSLEGNIKDLSSARNILKDSWHNSEDSPSIVNTEYRIATWWLTKPLEVGKTYTFRLFGFSNREHFMLYTPNGLVRMGDFMGNGTANVIRMDTTYNALKNRRVWEISFTATQYTINNMTEDRVSLYNYPSSSSSNGEIYWATLVEGEVGIDWTPAISDIVGQSEFSLFKRDYEATDKLVQETLTAIKSDTGSLSTRINDVKSTADGNKTTISNVQSTLVNKADKSELSKYATTTSLNQVKQTADGNEALIAKIQETPTSYLADYQKLINRANLVERTLGTTDSAVGDNISRMVQTSQMFQTEVIERTNLLAGMASGVGMTNDPYFDKGNNDISIYDNSKTDTITMLRESPTTSGQPYGKWRLRLTHGASSATVPNRGGIAKSTTSWANGTVVIKFVAYLPTGRSFSYNQNGLGNGWSAGWLTDNKGTGKWETYAYYYRFGTSGTFSTFGHLSVTGASSAFTWYLSEYDIINVGETSASKITQLSDNINLKVSKGDISNQINLNTQGVVIQGNKIALSGQTSVDGAFWAKEVNAIKVNADNITTGQLDGSRIRANSIDTNRLTGNISEFIRTNWNALEASVRIDGNGLLSTASDNSQVYLQNGIVGIRNPSGASIGQMGYRYAGGSPQMVLHTTQGSHFSLTQRVAGNDVQTIYITAGGSEYHNSAVTTWIKSNTTNIEGELRVNNAKDIRMGGGNITNPYGIYFQNGGELYSLSNGQATRLNGVRELQFQVNGTRKMQLDTTRNYMYQPLNMQGNGILEQSDERIKTNISPLKQDSLTVLRDLDYKKFNMIKDGRETFGFIAQQMQRLAPHIIREEDGYLTYDTMEYTHLIGHALQQHVAQTDTKVAQLEHKIASLQDELALLKGA